MTTHLQNTKPLMIVNGSGAAVPGNWQLGAVDEQLMPFGKVAKAIFVKANGLAAYYRSTLPPRYVA